MGSLSSVLGIVRCPGVLDFHVGSSKSDVIGTDHAIVVEQDLNQRELSLGTLLDKVNNHCLSSIS